MSEEYIRNYLTTLHRHLSGTLATDRERNHLGLGAAIAEVADLSRKSTARGSTIFFIGNGGSAAMASHLAIDFTKNGGMRALAFNDGAYLTCLANDLGFDQVFAKALDAHVRSGDLLIAISSSGRSQDILNGVNVARARGARVVTLSGFHPDNPLRGLGDVNFYVGSDQYGFVEISHLALAHAVLDLEMARGKPMSTVIASVPAD